MIIFLDTPSNFAIKTLTALFNFLTLHLVTSHSNIGYLPECRSLKFILISGICLQWDVGRVSVSEIGQKLARNLNLNKNEITSWDIVVVVDLLQRKFCHSGLVRSLL